MRNLALASSDATLIATVNGTRIGVYKGPHPDRAPIRLRSASMRPARVSASSNPLAGAHPTADSPGEGAFDAKLGFVQHFRRRPMKPVFSAFTDFFFRFRGFGVGIVARVVSRAPWRATPGFGPSGTGARKVTGREPLSVNRSTASASIGRVGKRRMQGRASFASFAINGRSFRPNIGDLLRSRRLRALRSLIGTALSPTTPSAVASAPCRPSAGCFARTFEEVARAWRDARDPARAMPVRSRYFGPQILREF